MQVGRVLALGFALLLVACGSPPGQTRAPEVAAPPRPPSPGRPFVVFREPTLVIDRLETPVAPPVTAGSAPSPATMASDAPAILTIDGSGALVAHRNGTATVRTTGGGELRVEVKSVSALTLVPSELTVAPGQEVTLGLHAAGGGELLPSGAVTWYTTAPQTAMVRDGRVRGGEVPGTAVVTAAYGGQLARAQVTVGERRARFVVRPERASLRRGEVVAFEAMSSQGSLPARWESRAPRVVAQLQGGVFQARARGKATVCAAVGKQVACGAVEVRE